MADPRPFERRLAEAIDRYGRRASSDVDARLLAVDVAASASRGPALDALARRVGRLRRPRAHDLLPVGLVAGVTLVVAVALAAGLGSGVENEGLSAVGAAAGSPAPVEARLTLSRGTFATPEGFETMFDEIITADDHTRAVVAITPEHGLVLDFDDDRLDGVLTGRLLMAFTRGDLIVHGVGRPRDLMFVEADIRISNADGAWTGTMQGAGLADATVADRLSPALAATDGVTMSLRGEEAYEGLGAIIHVDFSDEDEGESASMVFSSRLVEPLPPID